MPSSGPGKAYFVRTLLRDVMIGESGLAGINRRLEARKAGALLAMYAVIGLIAAAGVAVLSISYSRNRQFLDQIGKDITVLDQVPSPPRSASIERVVPRLDAIRGIVDATDRFRASTTWAMSWGLYQGAAIGNAAHDAYVRELESLLLPRVAGLIRSRMVQYASEPEKLYLYLKGYLMLNEPKHLDKEFLQGLTNLEWQHGSVVGPALASHLQSLLDAKGDALPPLPVDGTLVAQARSSIRQTSMSKIMYDVVKRRYADENGQGLRVDQLAGVGAESLFRRKSGVPISAPLPRLYTRDSFKEISQEGRVQLLAELTKNNWVWGDSATTAVSNANGLISGVLSLYENEYMHAWDGFLADLEFARFSTVAQTNEALRVLTSPTSPLRGILRVVVDNTALVETKPGAPAPSGVIDETKKKFTDTLSDVFKPLQGAAGMSSVEPGTMVTAHFQWVRQLTAGEPGKSQLDAIIATLADIQRQLDTLGPDVAAVDVVKFLASPTFRGQIQTLQQQAGELPSLIRPLVEEISAAPGRVVGSGATMEVEHRYDAEVTVPCQAVIKDRYPFADATHADVQMTDFSNVFGYGGLFDKFFSANLENMVDTSQTPWTWRPGAVNPQRRMLEQFQAARRIRDMFFPAGAKTPEVRMGVTITDLDPTATRFVMELEGQLLDEAHQAPAARPAVWPGPVPGQVALSFEGRFFDPKKTYGGPWALFRMIEATAEGPADAQQRVRLNVQNRYHRVRIMLEALRTGENPFASKVWRQFSCQS
jgi:type VI secretion system protein ImpL